MKAMKFNSLCLLVMMLISCSDNASVGTSSAITKTPMHEGLAVIDQTRLNPVIRPGEITNLETDQLFDMMRMGRVVLIDVRPSFFYRLGHIDGAINLPKSKYDDWQPELLPEIRQANVSGQIVVFYCQNAGCTDAYKTAMKFVNLGHTVSIYRAGWREWKRAGLQ
ncbi:MAG TPA: hypothetical protein DEP88_06250 [Verrucomicrobiales bacterium]|nr:hypothetical protein [Verrucomicrobiales bacterium]